MTVPREGWKLTMFQSGTHIVSNSKPDYPHYYVYATDRYEICKQLQDWLNGGDRQPWMDDLIKSDSGEQVMGSEGIKIYTTGGRKVEGYFDNMNGGKTKGMIPDPEQDIERAQLIYFLMTGEESK